MTDVRKIEAPHPMQPVGWEEGTIRFKSNAIVELLVDTGRWKMEELVRKAFTDEDRVQFAQLTGLPVSDFCSLPYVSKEQGDLAQSICDSALENRPALPPELTYYDPSIDAKVWLPKARLAVRQIEIAMELLRESGLGGCTLNLSGGQVRIR